MNSQNINRLDLSKVHRFKQSSKALRDNYLSVESSQRNLQNGDNSFENNVINKSNYSTEIIGLRGGGNDKSSLSIILPENQEIIKEEGMTFVEVGKQTFQIEDSGEEFI